MVYLVVKYKGRKVIRQYHSDRASALRTKKFVERGSEYARIETDLGKVSKARKQPRQRSRRSPTGLFNTSYAFR